MLSHSRATRLTIVLAVAGLIVGACSSDAGVAAAPPEETDWVATGGLRYPVGWIEDDTFDAGFSMYVAAWPLQRVHPGPSYQTGLPSTWAASNSPDETTPYSTIEGGLGWWTGTRFPIDAPKFSMGGVSADFHEWANGPGSGGGVGVDVAWSDWSWDEPQGKYGVAQLSPYVLFPPDGLNLAPGSSGELFGYGYHPLPIVDERTVVGPNGSIEVGDQSWTLFLSTADFQGPVAFFLPDFFAKPLTEEPTLAGAFDASPFLDRLGTAPNQPFDVETHDVPAVHAVGADGESYARISPFQFPDNGDGSESIILDRVSAYREGALSTAVAAWFAGGDVADPGFGADDTLVNQFETWDANDHFDWMIIPPGVEDGDPEHEIDVSSFVEVEADASSFRYRWNLDVVDSVDGHFLFPEYFRLVDDAAGRFGRSWEPIAADDVPPETGLVDHVFPDHGVRGDTRPFETPTDEGSPWRSPGPSSDVFETELADGSVVTYAWYRFVDQPAIRHHDFTDDERAAMQERAEMIHQVWGPDRAYLAPPDAGELASLDAGVVLVPPPGFEVGYVPIAIGQRLAETP